MANAEWEKVYQIKGLPVKFVWRGSPYNDLKATVEGGNRDYVTVARIVASSPISQAEAEKLAGEKWRQIKKTARNANAARNAKFKVGDVVSLKDGYSVPSGASGNRAVVVEVLRPAGGDFNYWLRFDGGREREQHGDQLRLANSARNAVIEKKLPPRGAGVYIEQQGASFAVGPTDNGWSVANYGGEGVDFAHGFKTASEAKSWCASKGYKVEDVILSNSLRSSNAVVQKAMNATGDRRDYYVVDEFGNAADGSKTPLPFDRASELFLKLTGSKSGNGKWGIIRRGEPASRARDWYGNIVSWNADTSVLRETAVNAARSTNAVVAKALNVSHKRRS